MLREGLIISFREYFVLVYDVDYFGRSYFLFKLKCLFLIRFYEIRKCMWLFFVKFFCFRYSVNVVLRNIYVMKGLLVFVC